MYGQCTVSGVDGCHRTGSGNNILPPIMSGKVKSRPSLKYGYVTVRAKIPQGDWLWPGKFVFWLVGTGSMMVWSVGWLLGWWVLVA